MKPKQLLTSLGFLLEVQLEMPFTEGQRQSFRNKYRQKENGKSSRGGFRKSRNAKDSTILLI